MNRTFHMCKNRRKAACETGRCSTAFTLVELLVVVAIIALLISILLPSLTRAKEQARMVACSANLKGLGTGYNFYTNQNNDWYPGSAGWGGDPPTWDHRIRPEIENCELLFCPSDRFDREPWYTARGTDEKNRYPRSYASNICIAYRGPSVYGDGRSPPYSGEVPFTRNGSVYRTTDVEIPAATITLADQWESWYYGSEPQPGIHNDYKGSGLFDGMWSSSVQPPAPSRGITFYHSDSNKANFLFCDGHAIPLPEGHEHLVDTNGNGRNDAGEFYYYKRKKW